MALATPISIRGPDEPQPVLSQGVGLYREGLPCAPLRDHFARIWVNQMAPGGERATAIVPDGFVDLLWMNGALWIAGPDRQANVAQLAGGAAIVGFRFRPGAASTWLRIPASDLTDRRVPLEALWGNEARHLADQMAEAPDSRTAARRLQAVLAVKATETAAPQTVSLALHRALGTGARQDGVRIHRLYREYGMSERSLRRHCHAAFGYGPKTLARILRFQRFLALARRSAGEGLAETADRAGYADQAHMTREVRSLSGFTPRQVLGQFHRH